MGDAWAGVSALLEEDCAAARATVAAWRAATVAEASLERVLREGSLPGPLAQAIQVRHCLSCSAVQVSCMILDSIFCGPCESESSKDVEVGLNPGCSRQLCLSLRGHKLAHLYGFMDGGIKTCVARTHAGPPVCVCWPDCIKRGALSEIALLYACSY